MFTNAMGDDHAASTPMKRARERERNDRFDLDRLAQFAAYVEFL
jgi:hypothetical protein